MTAHDAVVHDVRPNGAPYLALDDLTQDDPTMLALIERGRRFVDRGMPILILGETGTGKEYLARALHAYSVRRRAALVALNCASIPESLIESELFGYCRGAFSGALSQGMRGKIVQADGGTLFLDEIGDMPAAQQTRLLRVLSEREVTPLGAAQPTPVDVQLICATHQDLFAQVEAGRFREDLYYRIAVGVLRLPALRERSDREHLIARMLEAEWPGVALSEALSPAARERLCAHDWPGNLRQLRAAMRYACAVAVDGRIDVDDLPQDLMRQRRAANAAVAAVQAPAPVAPPATTAHAERERDTVLRALAASRWNISAAARTLGICRASLYRKLKSLDIPHVRDCAIDMRVVSEAGSAAVLSAMH